MTELKRYGIRMKDRKSLGQLGEDIACKYLKKNGYKIIERNHWKPWGEIDIVAKAKDKTLVFVEVKTMFDAGEQGLVPEDQATRAKLQKLKRTSAKFAVKNPDLIDDRRGWRMDLVAISLQESGHSIRHYENVF